MGKIVLEDFNEGNGYYKINLAYLNKEQVEEIEAIVSKWKPTDEDIKSCIAMCLTDANEQRFKDYGTNLKDCLAWLEKQGEQNPAWSEDDELYLEDAIHAAKELYYANCGGDELVDWLKSLKDRVQPQPQNEWSEEDERMHKASIRACQYMVENFENSTWDYEDAIEWLKSLKPQPQWKPSDEQLNALDEVYKTHGANNVCRRIIFNLLEQLKKL